MAKQAYVLNKGDSTYKEFFKGNTIVIKPGEKVKMQRREAIAFLSQISPPDKQGYPVEKKLVLVPIDGNEKEEEKFVCNLDGKEFDTQSDLDAYLAIVSNKTVEKDDTGSIRRRRREVE